MTTDKMQTTLDQQQNVKQLIEALRSGKYTQTHSVLKDDDGYCCLGVAAEGVLGRTFVDIYEGVADYGKNSSTNMTVQDNAKFGFNTTVTSDEVKFFRTLTRSGFFLDSTRGTALMFLNDQNIPFITIANIIENLRWDK